MLERVFENLGRWRHLPNYQLERRADVFFSVYLREVLEAELGVSLEETVIPELPIKRDLVWPDHPSSKSVKVDYSLFSRDRETVYFVELKTDAGSRREAQDHYLERTKELGFGPVLKGLREIVLATTAHGKYHHLTRLLADLGYLTVPADLEDYLYPTPRPGLTERLRGIGVCGPPSRIEVIYLQPEPSEGDRCIDFKTFAAHVSRHDDELSRLFAKSLLEWRAKPGGQKENQLSVAPPDGGGLLIRMGSKPGASFRVKAAALQVIEKRGAVIDARVPAFERVAVAFSGKDSNRMFVLEPGPEGEEFEYHGFYVRGGFRVVEKVNSSRKAGEAFREFQPG